MSNPWLNPYNQPEEVDEELTKTAFAGGRAPRGWGRDADYIQGTDSRVRGAGRQPHAVGGIDELWADTFKDIHTPLGAFGDEVADGLLRVHPSVLCGTLRTCNNGLDKRVARQAQSLERRGVPREAALRSSLSGHFSKELHNELRHIGHTGRIRRTGLVGMGAEGSVTVTPTGPSVIGPMTTYTDPVTGQVHASTSTGGERHCPAGDPGTKRLWPPGEYVFKNYTLCHVVKRNWELAKARIAKIPGSDSPGPMGSMMEMFKKGKIPFATFPNGHPDDMALSQGDGMRRWGWFYDEGTKTLTVKYYPRTKNVFEVIYDAVGDAIDWVAEKACQAASIAAQAPGNDPATLGAKAVALACGRGGTSLPPPEPEGFGLSATLLVGGAAVLALWALR